MKLKKNKMFGFLMVFIFTFSALIVYAAEALTVDGFVSKMEELGYEAFSYGDTAMAYPKDVTDIDADESYIFTKAESEEEAKEALTELYDEMDDYDSLSRSKVSSGNISCVNVSGVEDGEYGYLYACSVDDTVVMGVAYTEDKADDVEKVMKELGYYANTNVITYIIIGVLVVVIIIVLLVIFLANKKKKNMNNNFGQPMMNQNNNFGQPMMNQNNNFGQPMMNQNNNFGQPMSQNNNYPNNNSNF